MLFFLQVFWVWKRNVKKNHTHPLHCSFTAIALAARRIWAFNFHFLPQLGKLHRLFFSVSLFSERYECCIRYRYRVYCVGAFSLPPLDIWFYRSRQLEKNSLSILVAVVVIIITFHIERETFLRVWVGWVGWWIDARVSPAGSTRPSGLLSYHRLQESRDKRRKNFILLFA